MAIAEHSISGALIVGSRSYPLDITEASITRDEEHLPYVDAPLTIAGVLPNVVKLLDPRERARIRLTGSRVQVKAGQTVRLADMTAAYGGRPLSAVTETPAGLAALTARFGRFGTVRDEPQSWTADLLLRGRPRDLGNGTIALATYSWDTLLLDYRLARSAPWRPSSTLIHIVVGEALRLMGVSFTPPSDFVRIADDAMIWEPGVSAWDYLEPLLQATNRRLFCDERGAWQLVPRQAARPGSASLIVGVDALTEATDDLAIEEGWADQIIVKYSWTDDFDEEQVRYDIAQASPTVTRTLLHEFDSPWPGAGAAKRLLRRSLTRGRGFTATTSTDYSIEPGSTVFVSVDAGEAPISGYVTSTTWRFPDGLTDLATRGVVEASRSAWSAIPAGLKWSDIPAGLSWTELDQIIPEVSPVG